MSSEPSSNVHANNTSAAEQQSLMRLQRLSDGIFTLAMMLMVLQFDLPDLSHPLSAEQIQQFLLTQLPAIYIYLGTFILIAFYWLNNLAQFKYYQKTDTVHLWLNLLSLMFVVLVPYANDLSTLYELNQSVQIFYSTDLFLVGFFSCLSWWYGSYQHRLISLNLTTSHIREMNLENIIEPAICLLAIAVALINPNYWGWTFYLLIPVYLYMNVSKS